MKIGVAYYPEQWPEDRWRADARLIKQAGVDLVRLGEFAWAHLEPRRLQFSMDWLEKAIGIFAKEGLEVILCTPTAAPPTWLFKRHPSMVPEDQDGRRWFPGSRRHACLNNRPYRRYMRRIVRETAKVFGPNPHVVAWQIDHEIGSAGTGRCYCDDCGQAFREWLKRRYGTIDRLNRLWASEFWSQHVNDWEEIVVPKRTPGGPHPSLALDYERFISASARDFFSEQRALIAEYIQGAQPFTTDTLGLETDQIDQFTLGGVQDVLSVDNRPGGRDLDAVALGLDLVRSIKRKPFWVLEQQAGMAHPPAARRLPRPGQLRLWAFQAAARGAELISFSTWRTPPAGQQMHMGGMLDAEGRQGRTYRELAAAIAELKEKAGLWEGRLPRARVAMVLDYQCHWALRADAMGTAIDYMAQFQALYGVLRRQGVAVDIVQPDQNLDGYALLVAPMPVICRLPDAEHWKKFVENGGILVVTAPAGCRTEQNAVVASPPGPLAELLGIEVIERDTFGDAAEAGNLVLFGTSEMPALSLCSIVELHGAEALATYGADYYAGTPAVTCRALGGGKAYFLGTLSSPELYGRLLGLALEQAAVEPSEWIAESLEVIPLGGGDGPSRWFLLNHSADPCEIALGGGKVYRDLLTGREQTGLMALAGFDVVLLEG